MKNWAQQLVGAILVLAFALAVGGFVLVLRAQQGSLAATMAAAFIRAVSPPDRATNVPVGGEIRADYVSRPAHDPVIKLDPPAGVTLDNPHWDGTIFIVDYRGLRDNSLYRVALDQEDSTQADGSQNDVKQTGQHNRNDSAQRGVPKQINVRWSFRTGAAQRVTPTPSPTSAIPSISASPSITPSPSSTSGASDSLIWFHGPYTTLYGVDWSGKERKSLNSDSVIQSPDGTRLWRRSTVSDADGNPIGSVPVDQAMMWADDSRQFCGVTSTATGSYELEMLRINGPRDRVGVISVTPGTAQAPALAACSVLARRAVVVGQSSGYTWSVVMMSLSDGSVIYQRNYPNPVTRVVASHDGQYIAEQLPGNANAQPVTLIRQLPSGMVVAQLSGLVVQGFSWDGSLVAGATAGNASVEEARVVRWRNQQVVWHQCTCPTPYSLNVLAQPAGSKLAVIASWNHGLNWSFNIVDTNGTSQPVPTGWTPLTPAF
ncbi:MAG: hypothetical protein M3Z28_03990 [Candidatus Dormibacteraeota bacterium]|nr:hypothetical protein [Candidatus Dormibacteraeota bacterium]